MRDGPHTVRAGSATAAVRTHEEPARWAPTGLVRRLRSRAGVSLVLDGSGAVGGGWTGGPLVALDAEPCWPAGDTDPRSPADRLQEIDRAVAARRRRGGTSDTGVAVLVAYEALGSSSRPLRAGEPDLPGIVALRVDRSVRFHEPARARLTARAEDAAAAAALLDATRHGLDGLEEPKSPPPAARADGRPRTSLPREAYLAAVEAVQRRIAAGDVYQANLCQRLEVERRGDPFELWADLRRRQPAPRSAFLSWGETVVASQSPETFLSATVDGHIETLPIKGTRPRLADPVADRRAAEGLLASTKDRAELLMIVDLERNDLGRVCRTGSIRVPDLWQLESFATVHHLVARVTGELLPEVGVSRLLTATFPGGSISGAPKRRAMEILRELEPAPRQYFTGSLCWFGDDGSMDSSILIRTLVGHGNRLYLGAGGGIVADSDPEEEWRESNHKARALANALGFDPEEAS